MSASAASTAVPEPSTPTLFLTALAAALGLKLLGRFLFGGKAEQGIGPNLLPFVEL
jgi:hypothetical protein